MVLGATASPSLDDMLDTLTAEGELYAREGEGPVRCYACGHRCLIPEERRGICKVRFNRDGTLLVPRGYVAALQCDPTEKKPFFHVLPGSTTLTFGMLGCDLHCAYCQNWVTSQVLRDDDAVAPPRLASARRLVELALENGAPVIASSYNEPLITSDWAVEVFQEARRAGLACAFVSNGNGTPEVLEYLKPHVALYKVDLKGFSDRAYRELGGRLSNVLETIRALKRLGYWVEIVTLVVPGLNDDPGELRAMAEFLADVDRDMPWHVTAFHPDYKMTDRDRTGVRALLDAYDLGRAAGLRFVYPGNAAGQIGDRESTFCPECDALLIRRRGFVVLENRMSGSLCPGCGARIPGVWEETAPRQTAGLGFPKPVAL
ncbi:MAG: AmmeMemoRadiSam system radical SAM enzyme [Planctomycetes bacterium]|nr:AmmeMemoRadiSam system radical SAM enzyme [Planctomycetota bacterium]